MVRLAISQIKNLMYSSMSKYKYLMLDGCSNNESTSANKCCLVTSYSGINGYSDVESSFKYTPQLWTFRKHPVYCRTQ